MGSGCQANLDPTAFDSPESARKNSGVAPATGRARTRLPAQDLDVEPEGQQILDVEGVNRQVALHQIGVLFDPNALVQLALLVAPL